MILYWSMSIFAARRRTTPVRILGPASCSAWLHNSIAGSASHSRIECSSSEQKVPGTFPEPFWVFQFVSWGSLFWDWPAECSSCTSRPLLTSEGFGPTGLIAMTLNTVAKSGEKARDLLLGKELVPEKIPYCTCYLFQDLQNSCMENLRLLPEVIGMCTNYFWQCLKSPVTQYT